MLEAFTFVLGLMIVMAVVPVLAVLGLALAVAKRFIVRWHDPVEHWRYRVRLGGNVAYFVALLNALAVLYYFVGAGVPLGARFDPWISASVLRLPEGWYLATAVAFLLGGFLLKLTRRPVLAAGLALLFAVQVGIELWPALFDLVTRPGLFARVFAEVRRLHEGYSQAGGIAGTVMGTILAGLVYGFAVQAAYYLLGLSAFVIAWHGTLRLHRFAGHRFRPPEPRPGA